MTIMGIDETMKNKSTLADMYVLDSLANDIEDLEGILRTLNSDSVLGWKHEWGHPFERQEVVEALSRMIREDLVGVYALNQENVLEALQGRQLPPADFASFWFGITERGRLVHSNWEPSSS
jgi:hypothetical protein